MVTRRCRTGLFSFTGGLQTSQLQLCSTCNPSLHITQIYTAHQHWITNADDNRKTRFSQTAADPPVGLGNWRLLTVSKSDSFVNISMFWPPLPDPSSIDFFPFTFIWISQDRNLWNYSAQSRPRFYISLETPTRNITIGPVQDKESWALRCDALWCARPEKRLEQKTI